MDRQHVKSSFAKISTKDNSFSEFLTYHVHCRGARHGLKLNGKLERIQEQERLLLEKWKKKTGSSSVIDQSVSSLHKVDTEETVCKTRENSSSEKSKKKKKRKHKDCRAERGDCDVSYERTSDPNDDQCDSVKVKVTKKRKRDAEQLENESVKSDIEADLQNETERTKKKKIKKKKKSY